MKQNKSISKRHFRNSQSSRKTSSRLPCRTGLPKSSQGVQGVPIYFLQPDRSVCCCRVGQCRPEDSERSSCRNDEWNKRGISICRRSVPLVSATVQERNQTFPDGRLHGQCPKHPLQGRAYSDRR